MGFRRTPDAALRSQPMARAQEAWRRALADPATGVRLGRATPHYRPGHEVGPGELSLGENLRAVVLRAAVSDKGYDEHLNPRPERRGGGGGRGGGSRLFVVFGMDAKGQDKAGELYGPRWRDEESRAELQGFLDNVARLGVGRRVDEFLSVPFCGPDAPRRFLLWIMRESDPEPRAEAPGVATPREECLDRVKDAGGAFATALARDSLHFLPNDARRRAVGDILAHLRTDEPRPHWARHRVLCVSAPGMAFGMSALAHHLFNNHDRSDTRPWCYLPVSRGAATDTDPTYRSTVARLHAVFMGRDPIDADPEADAKATEERLAEVREAMSRTASVLIFDGYQETSRGGDEEAHLSSLIRDEPLVLLLRRLTTPRPDLLGGEVETPAFRDTRILVLGNAEVTPLSDRFDQLPAEPGGARTFPAPDAGDLGQVIDGLAGRREGDGPVSEALKRLAKGRDVGDSDLLILRALLRVPPGSAGEGEGPGIADAAELDVAVGSDERTERLADLLLARMAGPMAHLWDEGAERRPSGGPRRDHDTPGWEAVEPRFLALLTVASSDTGLRPGTLRRLFSRVRAEDRKRWEEAGRSAGDILAGLAAELDGILLGGPDETLGKLHREPQGLEYDPPEAPDADVGLDRVYEIPDLHLRELLRRSLDGKARHLRRTLSLLLADESLQQHAVMLKHSPGGISRGLRYFRRLAEGIHHGIRSLESDPPNGGGRGKRVWAAWGGVLPVLTSMVPSEPEPRVSYLYSAYRQHLEHAPDWHLSRMFGADAAKRQILRLFLGLPALSASSDSGHMTQIRLDARRNLARTEAALNLPPDLAELGGGEAGFWDDVEAEKILIDGAINADDPKSARAYCENGLKRLGLKKWHLNPPKALLDLTRKANPPERPSAARLDELARGHAKDVAAALAASPAPRAAAARAVGLLERYAIAHAHDGDRAGDERTALLKATEAYHWFRVARAVNLGIEGVERLKPSGASTRVFARCCISLAQASDDESYELFVHRARAAVNRLSLRMSRYASERGPLLVVESALARLDARRAAGSDPARRAGSLRRAAQLIQRAEDILPDPSNRPRLRMWFLLERANLSVDLAEAGIGKGEGALPGDAGPAVREGNLKVARRDLTELKEMAQASRPRRNYASHFEVMAARVEARAPELRGPAPPAAGATGPETPP